MIEIKNLYKTYSSKSNTTTALQNINLTINSGDVFGIIGLSGAGKSTLVRCINMLEKPTSGEIIIDGVDITKLSLKELRSFRKNISMIFQNFNLLEQRNVFQNVAFPLELVHTPKKVIEEKVEELLKLVGLSEKKNAYPSQLSGGQKQRVAIARALATNPTYLLCDEATSALDPETTHSVLELLKELNKTLKLTIIVISHQMSVIEAICNKVAIIDKSQIAEQGNLQDIFLSPKTDIAKKLIYSGHVEFNLKGEKLIKLMFNESIERPVITDIIQNCNILISVLYAETKVLNGVTYGQVMFRLPYYDEDIQKLTSYLDEIGVSYEEVLCDDFN